MPDIAVQDQDIMSLQLIITRCTIHGQAPADHKQDLRSKITRWRHRPNIFHAYLIVVVGCCIRHGERLLGLSMTTFVEKH